MDIFYAPKKINGSGCLVWRVDTGEVKNTKMVPESDVIALRDWLAKQPYLPQNLDDRILKRFLSRCDGSMERTKTHLDLFFTLRANCPEVFSNRDPSTPNLQTCFNFLDLVPLQDVTPEGYHCFILRFADSDPESFHMVEVLKMFFMVGDLELRKDLDLSAGLVTIFDMTGWSFKHLTRINISALGKCIQYAQDAVPVKVKQIQIINANPLLDKILAVIRPFIRSETASLIHSHSTGSDSLFQFIPKDILPNEYGGKAGPIKEMKDRLKKELEAEKSWFINDEWMADESKRVGKKTGTVRLEMQGSFRSLSLD